MILKLNNNMIFSIGIDGLPVLKNNSNQFEPILRYMKWKLNLTFLISLYFDI